MSVTKFVCPKCKKEHLTTMDGLSGLFCPDKECGYYEERAGISKQDFLLTPSEVFSEEKVKSVRGVPCNQICLGSETKGRLVIQIPCNAQDSERKMLIETAVNDLKYTKECIEKAGIDIYTSRKKGE